MFNKRLLVTLALCAAGSLMAQPSVYFKFQHKATKAVICESDPPDTVNWVKVGGPFQDANCTIPER